MDLTRLDGRHQQALVRTSFRPDEEILKVALRHVQLGWKRYGPRLFIESNLANLEDAGTNFTDQRRGGRGAVLCGCDLRQPKERRRKEAEVTAKAHEFAVGRFNLRREGRSDAVSPSKRNV